MHAQSPSSPSSTPVASVTHYENFPVASWLCPAHLRPVITALYIFARTADDMADEGNAPAAQRLALLDSYRRELHATAGGAAPQPQWAAIFGPLQQHMRQWRLPVALLDDLLSAFVQDIEKTRDGSTYADRAELLDYCRRSANPVGRLVLHLYGVQEDTALAQSDAICTALQLINFWQDLSEDIARGRHYLTDADCARFGVSRAALAAQRVTPQIRQLIADNTQWARSCMLQGAPLVHRLPGRAGWELRLVVQGGLRMLDRVEQQHGDSLRQRRTLGRLDVPLVLWRALWM